MAKGQSIRAQEVALSAVMIAVTAVVTMTISIPFPPTRGYFNLGDAIVMFSGLLLGARVGLLAGGIGSALADLMLGFAYFAPLTLIIKGIEGFLAGTIGYNRTLSTRIIAVVAAGIAMMAGYFSAETALIGLGPAVAELTTINWIQVTAGAIIALVLTQAVSKAYPNVAGLTGYSGRARTAAFVAIGAAVLLGLVVAAYIVTGISP
jgi:uncharacterized membrane protein